MVLVAFLERAAFESSELVLARHWYVTTKPLARAIFAAPGGQ